MVAAAPINNNSVQENYLTKQSISDLATDLRLTKGDIPPPLVGASTTVISHHVYVFGGRAGLSRQMTNSLYILDLSTLIWVRHIAPPDSAAPPVPRYFHSATSYLDRYIVIFGGMGTVKNAKSMDEKLCTMGDVCLFDTRFMSWIPLKIEPNLFAPQARYAHVATIWNSSKLVIFGGQDLSNHPIFDMHIFDLEKNEWIHGAPIQGTHDAYRTIAFDTKDTIFANRVCIYSNYNFSDISRDLISFDPMNVEDSKNHAGEMTGSALPPGLRFLTGHVMGHYFVVSGTYLSASHKMFQIWVMDLRTLAWSRVDTGHSIMAGSWNRGILFGKKFYILGHSQRDLEEDYGYRRSNFDHVAIVDLEASGICVPPPSTCSQLVQELGLLLLNNTSLGDVIIYTTDNQAILSNAAILSERWIGFSNLLRQKGTEETKLETQKMKIIFPETYAVTLAFLQYLYTDQLLNNQLHVLCRLLIFADMHQIDRLKELVVYALHQILSLSTASVIYETATLALQTGLQIRSLKMMIQAKRIIHNQLQQQKERATTPVSPSNSSSGNSSDQESISATSTFNTLQKLASNSSKKSTSINGSRKSLPLKSITLKRIGSSLTSRS